MSINISNKLQKDCEIHVVEISDKRCVNVQLEIHQVMEMWNITWIFATRKEWLKCATNVKQV